MTGVLVLLIGALVLITWAEIRGIRKNPRDLDLYSVRDALIEKQGWTTERADAAREEYVRFLLLLQMRPGFMLVPWLDSQGRDDLDQFWHQHILDTAKYSRDCKAVFGRMIHHNPHVVRGSVHEQEAIDKTRQLYVRRFQSGTFGSKPDPADSYSCSSCAAVISDSGHGGHGGSHGDSGGHGSDGGGHGCGGHGCGGHGCGGGGCGGH
jgi:hypothetical protein